MRMNVDARIHFCCHLFQIRSIFLTAELFRGRTKRKTVFPNHLAEKNADSLTQIHSHTGSDFACAIPNGVVHTNLQIRHTASLNATSIIRQ